MSASVPHEPPRLMPRTAVYFSSKAFCSASRALSVFYRSAGAGAATAAARIKSRRRNYFPQCA